MMKQWVVLLWILLLAACAPATNEGLPTLVRFATETEGPPPILNSTEAAQFRTPLPETFTPTESPSPSATLDPSVTASISPTVTLTPSATITDTPSPTGTNLPTLSPNDRPLLAFALTAYAATVLPAGYQIPAYEGVNVTLAPTVISGTSTGGVVVINPIQSPIAQTCSSLPTGGFLTVYQSNPDIAALLGCVNGTAQSIPAAAQSFEQGRMLWLNGEILALYNLNDNFQSYPDTFVQGVDPENSSETPPTGLLAPIRGFLKVWANNPSVRTGLGWARLAEQGTSATSLSFASGRMIHLAGESTILVFLGVSNGTWLAFQGQY